MKSNTKLLPFLKKQLLKISISFIISSIIVLALMSLPSKKQAELSLSFNLKPEIDILNYLSIFSNRNASKLEAILNLEPSQINQILLTNINIINECKLYKDKSFYIWNGKMGSYNLTFDLIVDREVDIEKCYSVIEKDLNQRTKNWLYRLKRILEIKKLKAGGIDSDEVNDNIMFKIIQNNQILLSNQLNTDLDLIDEFIGYKTYYNSAVPLLLPTREPKPLNVFIITFFILLFLLNFKNLIKILKQY
tara:strand:+ start:67 stop:810 length:744 start_codon:yes stop_codon:yes gene_type:complete